MHHKGNEFANLQTMDIDLSAHLPITITDLTLLTQAGEEPAAACCLDLTGILFTQLSRGAI